MTLEQNKALATRMLNWWVGGDVSVIDETNAPDFVSHSSDGGGTDGRDAYKDRLSGFIGLFSDRTIEIEDVIAEGDKVVVRYSWGAVAPGNRQVNSKSMAIYRIVGGKIAEEWEEHDTRGLGEQLGM
jgi:predicted SnoaL-like aldol condensation-catalyzing enzyme